MKRLVVVLLLLLNSFGVNAARYVFKGENYNFINGSSYDVNMRVTGFFEVDEVLEPNQFYDMGVITSYRFSDGLLNMSPSDSVLSPGSFRTDAEGLPFFYRFTFTKKPATNVVGESLSRMTLRFGWNTEGFERDEGGFTGLCLHSGDEMCLYADNSEDSGEFTNPGLGGAPIPDWSLQSAGGLTRSVPLIDSWGLLLLVSSMMVFGFRNARSFITKS